MTLWVSLLHCAVGLLLLKVQGENKARTRCFFKSQIALGREQSTLVTDIYSKPQCTRLNILPAPSRCKWGRHDKCELILSVGTLLRSTWKLLWNLVEFILKSGAVDVNLESLCGNSGPVHSFYRHHTIYGLSLGRLWKWVIIAHCFCTVVEYYICFIHCMLRHRRKSFRKLAC